MSEALYTNVVGGLETQAYARLEAEKRALQAELRDCRAKLAASEAAVSTARAEKAVLATNISSLYKTARAEIGRHEATIQELREKLQR